MLADMLFLIYFDIKYFAHSLASSRLEPPQKTHTVLDNEEGHLFLHWTSHAHTKRNWKKPQP